ncbi:MAG: CofH family radical SAM protein [bacterium]
MEAIYEKVKRGERITRDEGVSLFNSSDLINLGQLADQIRKKRFKDRCFFSLNININPTNICVYRCPLCAFSRDLKDGFLLSFDEIIERVKCAYNEGIREVHIVGGCHPELDISYYEGLFQRIKEIGDIFIQGLTVIEIDYIAKRSGLTIKEALIRLKNKGLGSIPGGGAEVFSERVRQIIAPNKPKKEVWLSVMKEAHKLGIRSNATMLFGTVETNEEIIEHLISLRELQDETGGFMAFVPLAFHPKNTGLSHLEGPDYVKILKVFAISRIMLDNFPHIKGVWMYLEKRLIPLALQFGVDDIGGLSWDEKIVSSTSPNPQEKISKKGLTEIIKLGERRAVCVNSIYERAED